MRCLIACVQAELSRIDDEALVYALQLRAAYGGMGFDVKCVACRNLVIVVIVVS